MYQHHMLKLKIGSFSAASNVMGIQSDTKTIAKILHKYGAKACFNFAAAGPHVTMDVNLMSCIFPFTNLPVDQVLPAYW
jgi:selenocysteine lyase/cysteine desulfurase